MPIDVRRAASRFVTRTDWVESRHSFSFGPHYDPLNTRFGSLVAHNDDVLQPGGEFAEHPHRDVDIVTWVVEGGLRHRDNAGGTGLVTPGVVQRLSAGSGIRHAEANAADGITRYVQMWVMADADGPPDYAIVAAPPGAGRFDVVASGNSPAPLTLRQSTASLFVAQLRAGEATALPQAALVHLFVLSGSVEVGGPSLSAGDAVRVSDAGSPVVAAGVSGAQLLAWAMGDAWRPPR
jgi:quercetin 2,3-dioxygenase